MTDHDTLGRRDAGRIIIGEDLERRSDVQLAIERSQKAAAVLQEALEQLHERLEPVLAGNVKSDGDRGGTDQDQRDIATDVPLAVAIHGHADRLDRLVDVVRGTHARLGL